jgi:hypothetical protein
MPRDRIRKLRGQEIYNKLCAPHSSGVAVSVWLFFKWRGYS